MLYLPFDTSNKVAFKEMCKVISKNMTFTLKRDGRELTLTPQQVWEYSPTGEVYMIPIWYRQCLYKLEYKARLVAGEKKSDVTADMTRRWRAWERKFMGGA